jgi:hypothetical protein
MPLCVRELLYAFGVRARQKLSCLLVFKSRRKVFLHLRHRGFCVTSSVLRIPSKYRIAVSNSDTGIRLDCVQRLEDEVSAGT